MSCQRSWNTRSTFIGLFLNAERTPFWPAAFYGIVGGYNLTTFAANSLS
jgi:hypothetical protein